MEREKLVAMVRGLQNQDPEAAALLYETFQSDYYYLILKNVDNDRDLAEDLTQDTFVEILETVKDLQEPAAFVTWSRQIAYHRCTNYFKKRRELLVDENEDGYSVFDTVEEDREEFIPDAALDHEDLRNTIVAMVNDLPEEQKAAIILRYFNEISVKEIAEIQGVSEGTVKSRLNYGRKSIRQAVEEYEKKNDIKLHSVGILPLLLWMFRGYRSQKDLHISSGTHMQEFVFAEDAAGAAVWIGSSASVSGAAAAAAGGTAAKVAAVVGGKVISTKVLAGILAAALAVGGISLGISSANSQSEDFPKTTLSSDASGEEQNSSQEDPILAAGETTGEATEETTEETTEPICEHPNQRKVVNEKNTNYYNLVCMDCGVVIKDMIHKNSIANESDSSEDAGNPVCDHNWVLVKEFVGSQYINKFYECSVCGSEDAISYPNTCSHEYVLLDHLIQPDYEMFTYRCKVCGIQYSEMFPLNSSDTTTQPSGKDHTHQPTVTHVAPTCNNDGYHQEECLLCGEVLIYTELPSTGHDDYVIARVEPSVGVPGYITYGCTRCTHSFTDTLPALPEPDPVPDSTTTPTAPPSDENATPPAEEDATS